MTYPSHSILVVEDNKDLLNLLDINLSDQGYTVFTAENGVLALEMFHAQNPDLVVLDVMLPKLDGFEVCKRIRNDNKMVPILMLTAKAEELDKVLGLELGADDYMTKPFSIREFLARIKAMFRRIDATQFDSENDQQTLEFDNLIVDSAKRRVTLKGEFIDLTNKEYDLLLLFFKNPGKSYSREELLNIVWGYSHEGYSHTVNSHINRLRSKIIIDTDPLDRFINGKPMPILAADPMHPELKKPFSAANISIMGSEGCYLYVVLEGDQFTQATAMITDSYIVRGTLMLLGVILLISLITGLFVFSNLTSRLKKIKKTVTGFERGQLNDRIEVQGNDELSDLSVCFNRMADTLVDNMKEIQKTDRLRRELVANVSHDLRSPIASIQGYLETIQMKGETITKEELNSYFGTVLSNTQKLNRLIDDLFELSKLDAEEVTPNLENISMAELIQDLVLQFNPISEKKGVTLEAEFSKNPNALIEADISLMNRALTNLIDNAIQHTPKGGKVTISSIKSGEDFVLEISDTGCGISDEDLPHVFDRFYQADMSRSEKQGAGLGLAIAQKIFRLHGADVKVSSIENQGTTFSVAIPGNGF